MDVMPIYYAKMVISLSVNARINQMSQSQRILLQRKGSLLIRVPQKKNQAAQN